MPSLEVVIDHTLMPDPPPRRSVSMQFSWKLFLNGRIVARSADYFPSEDGARAAYDDFCAALETDPPIVDGSADA